ncbi:uncharacterized protein LOC112903829 [Panicum hallii]|uniref:uncharacterized protein LOC112903829 n=1 Tax=Panicum hallii TaxID=206008 RepID=UPI000DF4D77B|nr:uncharacterized protein LOC112903829 [Panicum hallii]
METEATQQPPPGSSAVTAAYPRSVLLKHYAEDVDVGSCPAADARTLAVSRTSTGHPVAVSLSLAAPPALSSVRVHFPRGVEGATGYVFAAHGDSLLICAYFKEGYRGGRPNYFVYDAGAASAEPPGQPSLFLLPPHWLAEQGPGSEGRSRGGGAPAWRFRDKRGTGLLRRGEDEPSSRCSAAASGASSSQRWSSTTTARTTGTRTRTRCCPRGQPTPSFPSATRSSAGSTSTSASSSEA